MIKNVILLVILAIILQVLGDIINAFYNGEYNLTIIGHNLIITDMHMWYNSFFLLGIAILMAILKKI